MRILVVIDSLGSGGAQRQIVNLAVGLKNKGHDVELLLYHPEYNFFRSEVNNAAIYVHEFQKSNGFSIRLLFRMIYLFVFGRFEAVISFLDGPNLYSELAKILSFSSVKLVVSERRSFKMENHSISMRLFRFGHIVANKVVANSRDHAEWLMSHKWLKNKTSVIYNGYKPKLLDVNAGIDLKKSTNYDFIFLVLSRIDTIKNPIRLFKALVEFKSKCSYSIGVFWAGRQEQDELSAIERKTLDDLLIKYPDAASCWHWLGERNDIECLFRQSDALIHVSLYEGLSNSICEALLYGLPVIASNVSDNAILVEDGSRGFLCDPLSHESIFLAINKFVTLSQAQRQQLGVNASSFALRYLSIDRMISEYEKLIINDI